MLWLRIHLASGHHRGGARMTEAVPQWDVVGTRGAGDQLTVARVAAGLGLSWHTRTTLGTPGQLCPRRRMRSASRGPGPVRRDSRVIGVDEHLWAMDGARAGPPSASGTSPTTSPDYCSRLTASEPPTPSRAMSHETSQATAHGMLTLAGGSGRGDHDKLVRPQ